MEKARRGLAELRLSDMTWKEISDPIYGYVYYNREIEEGVINTAGIQRLRYIMQLQTAHLVYPGAVHTRFQHSLGVMHLAGLMAEDALRKLARAWGEGALEGRSADELVEAARLAGLLHDVGHAAFGHTFEEAVLLRRGAEEVANHERVGLLLYDLAIADRVEELGRRWGMEGLAELVRSLLDWRSQPGGVLGLLRKVVRDSLYPADVLDFLRRDSYYAGTQEHGRVDHERLYRNTYPSPENPGELAIDRAALGELRAYMVAKASMYQHVYYHSVARAFDRLLFEILELLDEELGLYSAVEALARGRAEDFLLLTDARLYSVMLEAALKGSGRLAELCRRLLIERKPEWKRVGREVAATPYKRGWSMGKVVHLAYGEGVRARVSRELAEVVAERAGADPSDVWVDVFDVAPIPRSVMYAAGGELRLLVPTCKSAGGRVVADAPIDLVAEGMPFAVVARAYVRRGKYRPELEAAVSEALEDYFSRLAEQLPDRPAIPADLSRRAVTA